MPQSMPQSIIIVSDHQLFSECLASVLASQDGTIVVCATPCLEGIFGEVTIREPNIVLIDFMVSKDIALDLTRQISQHSSQIKVIILGLDSSRSQILECIEAGAIGYVLKDASLNELSAIIESVSRGEAICSPGIAHSAFVRIAELTRQHSEQKIFGAEDLTARETEILWMITEGLSNKEIAQLLNLSSYTVKNHVHNILEKLRVHSRSQATRLAEQKGLLKGIRLHRKRSIQDKPGY